MSSIAPFSKTSSLEAFMGLVRLGNVRAANEVLDAAFLATGPAFEGLEAEERDVWFETVAAYCLDTFHQALPLGIEPLKLANLGLPVMDSSIPVVGRSPFNSAVLVNFLKYVHAVSEVQLQGYAEATDFELFDEATGVGGPWDIHHESSLLFAEKVFEREQPLVGVYGYAYIDWLPGITSYDAEAKLLSDFGITLKPHAAEPLKVGRWSDHIHVKRLSARVVDGKLKEVNLEQLFGAENLSSFTCDCKRV